MTQKKTSKSFITSNLPLLSFGLLFTFSSGFGQTYLLSLYVPAVEGFLNISNTEFGSLYAIATIGSALSLPWLGGYFDRVELKPYSLVVMLGLAASMLLLSVAANFLMVLIAFYGLRLFGQGLSSHTSFSAMARYFSTNRGKAIGLVSLGYPASEAILPILIALLIAAMGWRGALQLSALQFVLITIPLTIFLLKKSSASLQAYKTQSAASGKSQNKVRLLKLLKQKEFWIISPIVFMLGFTTTAVFFFQLKLGESRGWSAEWVAASISAFALAGAFGMLGSGSLVDRFSGKKLFPFFLLPYLLGLGVLILFDQPLAYPTALALMGLSNGMGSTINNAMLAEIYGTAVIGQIRSLFITVMVGSTALGPIIFGVLLDYDTSYSVIFFWAAVALLLAALNGLRRL
jgi:MFS family permease